jgi:hypothetical protein
MVTPLKTRSEDGRQALSIEMPAFSRAGNGSLLALELTEYVFYSHPQSFSLEAVFDFGNNRDN